MSRVAHLDYAAMTRGALLDRLRVEAKHITTVFSFGEIDQCLSMIRAIKSELTKRGEWKPGAGAW